MLRPLVRFCLRSKLTFTDAIRVLKVVFVEVGEEELRKVTDKVNVSRLSLLTGVHRKDVDDIFHEKRTPQTYSVSIAARVVNQWEQDRRYHNKSGKPRPLTFQGENNEFRRLVESVSTNLNAGTVLFELDRVGLVERTKTGLKLLRSTNRFDKSSEHGFELMSRDVESLISAVMENVIDPKQVLNLHIRTEYDNVLLSKSWEIRKWILNLGRSFHKKVRDHVSRYDRDISDLNTTDPGGGRVVVGAFSFTTIPEETSSN